MRKVTLALQRDSDNTYINHGLDMSATDDVVIINLKNPDREVVVMKDDLLDACEYLKNKKGNQDGEG